MWLGADNTEMRLVDVVYLSAFSITTLCGLNHLILGFLISIPPRTSNIRTKRMTAPHEASDSPERDSKGAMATVTDDEAKVSDERILVSKCIYLARP